MVTPTIFRAAGYASKEDALLVRVDREGVAVAASYCGEEPGREAMTFGIVWEGCFFCDKMVKNVGNMWIYGTITGISWDSSWNMVLRDEKW